MTTTPGQVAAVLASTTTDPAVRATLAVTADFGDAAVLGPIDATTAKALAKRNLAAAAVAARSCTDADWLLTTARKDRRVTIVRALAVNPALPADAARILIERELEGSTIDAATMVSLWSKLRIEEAIASWASADRFARAYGRNDRFLLQVMGRIDDLRVFDVLRQRALPWKHVLGSALAGNTVHDTAAVEKIVAGLDAADRLEVATIATHQRVTAETARILVTVDPWVGSMNAGPDTLLAHTAQQPWTQVTTPSIITPEAQAILIASDNPGWRRFAATATELTQATVDATLAEGAIEGLSAMCDLRHPATVIDAALRGLGRRALGRFTDLEVYGLADLHQELSLDAKLALWADPARFADWFSASSDPETVKAVLVANDVEFRQRFFTRASYSLMQMTPELRAAIGDLLAAEGAGLVPLMFGPYSHLNTKRWVVARVEDRLGGSVDALSTFAALASTWTGSLDDLIEAARSLT